MLSFIKTVFAPSEKPLHKEVDPTKGICKRGEGVEEEEEDGRKGPYFGVQGIQECCNELDITEEAMETVLSYLQVCRFGGID